MPSDARAHRWAMLFTIAPCYAWACIAFIRRSHSSLGFQTTLPLATSSATAGSSCFHSLIGRRTRLTTGTLNMSIGEPHGNPKQNSLSTFSDRLRKQAIATTFPPAEMIRLTSSPVVEKLLQTSSTITHRSPSSTLWREKTSFDFSREVEVLSEVTCFSALIMSMLFSTPSASAREYPPIGAPQKTSTSCIPTAESNLTARHPAKNFSTLA